uniref:Uncharacterized protein n=1 Tax=Anguilla anguilla TaxID=7936 RepID=A0A0E9WH77_ANGAN
MFFVEMLFTLIVENASLTRDMCLYFLWVGVFGSQHYSHVVGREGRGGRYIFPSVPIEPGCVFIFPPHGFWAKTMN